MGRWGGGNGARMRMLKDRKKGEIRKMERGGKICKNEKYENKEIGKMKDIVCFV